MHPHAQNSTATPESSASLVAANTSVPAVVGRSGRGAAVGLNPRYTFDTFVKGASNQFALAAAQRVAETPGRSYNPLFIYGSAGLGKTHLLHAIGSYVHEHYPNYEVRYVSTETFLNEYVDGIRNNTISAFKRRYREVDVLLIDDIQFMEGKEGLQEEFFHTFNALFDAHKQIILNSDRPASEIPELEHRLVSRFEWGLVTELEVPDVETRIASRDVAGLPAGWLDKVVELVRRTRSHGDLRVGSSVRGAIDMVAFEAAHRANVAELKEEK